MNKTKYFIPAKGIRKPRRCIFSSNECDLSFTAFIKLTLKHPFCVRDIVPILCLSYILYTRRVVSTAP